MFDEIQKITNSDLPAYVKSELIREILQKKNKL